MKQLQTTAIVPGSIAQIALATNRPLAMVWLKVKIVVLIDISSSMEENDCPGGRTRYAVACDELAKLQAQNPGAVAVVEFSDTARLKPGGVPSAPNGTTNLAGALAYARQFDTPGVRFVVVSDGAPNVQSDALEQAALYKNRIDTIFCGPEEDDEEDGEYFLAKLATANRGRLATARSVVGIANVIQSLQAA